MMRMMVSNLWFLIIVIMIPLKNFTRENITTMKETRWLFTPNHHQRTEIILTSSPLCWFHCCCLNGELRSSLARLDARIGLDLHSMMMILTSIKMLMIWWHDDDCDLNDHDYEWCNSKEKTKRGNQDAEGIPSREIPGVFNGFFMIQKSRFQTVFFGPAIYKLLLNIIDSPPRQIETIKNHTKEWHEKSFWAQRAKSNSTKKSWQKSNAIKFDPVDCCMW